MDDGPGRAGPPLSFPDCLTWRNQNGSPERHGHTVLKADMHVHKKAGKTSSAFEAANDVKVRNSQLTF